jgi:hypothetical protein
MLLPEKYREVVTFIDIDRNTVGRRAAQNPPLAITQIPAEYESQKLPRLVLARYGMRSWSNVGCGGYYEVLFSAEYMNRAVDAHELLFRGRMSDLSERGVKHSQLTDTPSLVFSSNSDPQIVCVASELVPESLLRSLE